MNEAVILFGPDENLLGFVTPAAGPQAPVGVLMLNSGVVHRIGPHRLSVKLSRHLATLGYTCMRFDFSGVGDSRMPRDAVEFQIQAVRDAKAAMDWLEREHGIRKFALFGMCSGAVNAYSTALEDPRVTGVFMFDGYVYRTIKSQLIYLRALGVSNALRLVSHTVLRRLRRTLARRSVEPPVGDIVSTGNPTPEEFGKGAQRLVDRGVHLAFLFSGHVRSLYSYAGQLGDMFRSFSFPGQVACHFAPDMDHSAALLESQRQLTQLASEWVRPLSLDTPDAVSPAGSGIGVDRQSAKLTVRELDGDWVANAGETWSHLLAKSDAHPVFMSWAWIFSATVTLGPREKAVFLGVFDGEDLVAVLPLFQSHSAATQWGRSLSLAGAEKTGADYSDLICQRGFERAASVVLANWLLQRKDWIQIRFVDVSETAAVRHLADCLGADAHVEDVAGSVSPRVSLAGGWEGYLQAHFGKKHRYNIKRQIRLVDEAGLKLVFHETPESVARAFSALAGLHGERKGSQGIESAFTAADRVGFHQAAALQLARSGSAFVATLEASQQTVCAAYCLRSNDTIFYFQTGVSAQGLAIGAGSTLLYMLMHWAADNGYVWFDLLKGDEKYKTALSTSVPVQRRITVTRANTHGDFLRAVMRGKRGLKRVLGHPAVVDGASRA